MPTHHKTPRPTQTPTNTYKHPYPEKSGLVWRILKPRLQHATLIGNSFYIIISHGLLAVSDGEY